MYDNVKIQFDLRPSDTQKTDTILLCTDENPRICPRSMGVAKPFNSCVCHIRRGRSPPLELLPTRAWQQHSVVMTLLTSAQTHIRLTVKTCKPCRDPCPQEGQECLLFSGTTRTKGGFDVVEWPSDCASKDFDCYSSLHHFLPCTSFCIAHC